MNRTTMPSQNTIPGERPATGPFLSALAGVVTPRVPFWLMRQAGRYLPEYRALRAKAGGFLAMCDDPVLATEITLQPLRRFDMDAAIIFSDILMVPRALGQDLSFVAGEGPCLAPLRRADDVAQLSFTRFSQKLEPLGDALTSVRKALPKEKALIGFVGAPWTVACYMVDGHGGDFAETRRLVLEDPSLFDSILDLVVTASIESLCLQIKAGADAVQIFDSWAGLAARENIWDKAVVIPTAQIVTGVKARHPHIPIIGFPRGCPSGQHATYIRATGVDALGLDQGVVLADVVGEIAASGQNICLQGNLDPEILLKGGAGFLQAMRHILDTCRHRPFVFNLGHGVIKETPPEHVAILAETVRSFQR